MGKIFITGATGQVGSHLTHLISTKNLLGIKNSTDILCLVRKGRDSWDEKTRFLRRLGVKIVEGSLTDKKKIELAFKNNPEIEYVFHTAAQISPAATYRELYKPNVMGTRNILELFAKSPNGKSFVHCSSISAYSTFMTKDKVTIVDETTPLGSITENEPYPITKIKCEYMIQDFVKKYPDKSFIITRIGAIAGARDRQLIPSFVTFLSIKYIPKLIGGGTDYFALVAPMDIARAQVFLAERGSEISGEAYNLANKPPTYRQIYKIISDYYGMVPPAINIPISFFNLIKPILPWVKKMFPNNGFLQTALSPSAIEFIGKSFIFKTDKIEKLGFKFMMSAKETITSALRDAYPTEYILDPALPTNDDEGAIRSLLELDQSLTAIELKEVEEKVKKSRECDELLDETSNITKNVEIRNAKNKLKRAKNLEEQAKITSKKIRKNQERLINIAKRKEMQAIQRAKAEMNQKIKLAHEEYTRKITIAQNKIKKAEFIHKNTQIARNKAEDELLDIISCGADKRFKKIFD